MKTVLSDMSASVYVSIIGWFVLLGFHMSSLHRAEIARKKDKLVGDVEGLLEWGCEPQNHEQFGPEVKETMLSSRVTLIERRANSLFVEDFGWDNALVGYFVEIRDIDISSTDLKEQRDSFQSNMHEVCDCVIEKIESSYEEYCKKRTWMSKVRFFKKHKDTLFGMASMSVLLFIVFFVIF